MVAAGDGPGVGRRVQQRFRALLGELEGSTVKELSGERLGLSRPRLAPAVWRLVRVWPGWAPAAGRVAAVLADSLAARPVLCDLISAQAAELERNVSAEEAAQDERAALAHATEPGRLIGEYVPELDDHRAGRVAAGTLLVRGDLDP
ncbi:hypothetical protein [Streptomyces griseus]|uniref:hypothetical protein n=1 Tax=Streptomyces griseus TaxID=1911 RepID=UPI001CEF91F5|nr:hypothetical protein [Streptomyces griseus]